MTERMSIEGPVHVEPKDFSNAGVALDLMRFLGSAGSDKDERATRKYWLTLYRQCYKATSGCSLEEIMKED